MLSSFTAFSKEIVMELLSDSELQRLTSLAKIELTPEDNEKYRDISELLNFINSISAVELPLGIEPLINPAAMVGPLRPDKVVKSEINSTDLVECSGEVKNSFYQVHKSID